MNELLENETRKCKKCGAELYPDDKDYCPHCHNEIDGEAKKGKLGILFLECGLSAISFFIGYVSGVLTRKDNKKK